MSIKEQNKIMKELREENGVLADYELEELDLWDELKTLSGADHCECVMDIKLVCTRIADQKQRIEFYHSQILANNPKYNGDFM